MNFVWGLVGKSDVHACFLFVIVSIQHSVSYTRWEAVVIGFGYGSAWRVAMENLHGQSIRGL